MSQRYDVFICFKNLDDEGRPTEDAALAWDVHDFLAARDLSVFFSSVSLEKLGISAYRKSIDQALDSARVLVAVGTSAANLDSEWVRYEWDSFFSDVLSGVKPEARVFVYAKGVPLKDLPRALRQSQVISHAPGSLELLFNFIANALGREPIRVPVAKGDGEYEEPPPAIETILRDIDEMIHGLENFHSNPEGIYYIGQTLVRCASFLEDHEIKDASTELTDDLMEELDSDERKKMGALDPGHFSGQDPEVDPLLQDDQEAVPSERQLTTACSWHRCAPQLIPEPLARNGTIKYAQDTERAPDFVSPRTAYDSGA